MPTVAVVGVTAFSMSGLNDAGAICAEWTQDFTGTDALFGCGGSPAVLTGAFIYFAGSAPARFVPRNGGLPLGVDGGAMCSHDDGPMTTAGRVCGVSFG